MKCIRIVVLLATVSFVFFLSSVGEAQMGPKETAFAAIERNKDEIAKVGDAIYSFAELGMQEFETQRYLTGLLEKEGFTIQLGVAGIPHGVYFKLHEKVRCPKCNALVRVAPCIACTV